MVSQALKLTIKAYVGQIIQVFPYSFITTDFLAVVNKKSYVWSFGSRYTSMCDVNCFNGILSFEYTNFCLIIYLNIFQQNALTILRFL